MKSTSETNIRLDTLKQLVTVLAEAISPSYEFLLHDLRNLDSSCIAISGDVTGRKVGAPMTDFGLRMLKSENSSFNLINYSSKSAEGKPLRSSTCIIRNSKGKPIAFVCINFDLSSLSLLRDFIDSSFPKDFPPGDLMIQNGLRETYPRDTQDIMKATFSEVLKQFDKPPSIMNKKDKLRVVKLLDEAGIFAIKKSHFYIASMLNISRYSVYNYLNEVRHSDNKN